jgi:serine/threonine protein kinase
MAYQNTENIIVKFAKNNYISNIIKLLSLTSPNKVLPTDNEFYDMEKKINYSNIEYTDNDDCSTVALSSNPSSFTSNESAEEYFSNKTYSFTPNKFVMQSVLGKGSFGTVVLAKYENKQYAVKKLPKHRIENGEFDQILVEKQILMQMDTPFALKLYGTCQTKNELYFVTEVLEHGDLFSVIYDGDRLSHGECVFYAACIVMALDFMYNKKIVYRDLKPENIMIGSNGYPKIIDFGLAKQLPYIKLSDDGTMRKYSKCYSLCGTPEYVAPEIILRKGYDTAVDIWAFGVLLYEMICRRTPFLDGEKNGDYIVNMFTNIVLCGKNGIEVSRKIDTKTDGTQNARNLMTQLLCGDATKRLGPNNAPAILLTHPYFLSTGICYDDLYNQSIEAPCIPSPYVGNDIDILKDVEEYQGDQDRFNDF